MNQNIIDHYFDKVLITHNTFLKESLQYIFLKYKINKYLQKEIDNCKIS